MGECFKHYFNFSTRSINFVGNDSLRGVVVSCDDSGSRVFYDEVTFINDLHLLGFAISEYYNSIVFVILFGNNQNLSYILSSLQFYVLYKILSESRS